MLRFSIAAMAMQSTTVTSSETKYAVYVKETHNDDVVARVHCFQTGEEDITLLVFTIRMEKYSYGSTSRVRRGR